VLSITSLVLPFPTNGRLAAEILNAYDVVGNSVPSFQVPMAVVTRLLLLQTQLNIPCQAQCLCRGDCNTWTNKLRALSYSREPGDLTPARLEACNHYGEGYFD